MESNYDRSQLGTRVGHSNRERCRIWKHNYRRHLLRMKTGQERFLSFTVNKQKASALKPEHVLNKPKIQQYGICAPLRRESITLGTGFDAVGKHQLRTSL